MTRIVSELGRRVSRASHLAVMLVVLLGVALMHIAVSSPAAHSFDESPSTAVHLLSVAQPPVIPSPSSSDAQLGDGRVAPTSSTKDDDHHGAVILCCVLALSGIATLVARRSGQLMSRSPLVTALQHTARDIAVLIERSRPPDLPPFSLGVIRT